MVEAETDKGDLDTSAPAQKAAERDSETGSIRTGARSSRPAKTASGQRSKQPAGADAAAPPEGLSPKSTAAPTNLTLALGVGAQAPGTAAGTEKTAADAATAGIAGTATGTPTTTPNAIPSASGLETGGELQAAGPPDAASAATQAATPAAPQTAATATSHAQSATHVAAAAASADPKAAAADATIAAAAPRDAAVQLAAPQTTTTTPIASDAATSATATPDSLRAAPEAAVQVYHRIIERHDGRSQRFEMRLDPAELGRVDIRIEVNADKKVHAVLAAHDSAALSDLVKGQKGLEQAFRDSGLDLADGGLTFELSADNGRSFAGSQNRSQAHYEPGFFSGDRANLIEMPTTPEAAAVALPAWRQRRLNLVA